jgi:hypothetical protein
MRFVRMLVFVLACSIACSGYAAAAMPLHPATPAPIAGDGCDHHAAATAGKHAHHADGCCGIACACAFAHAIGAVAQVSVTGVAAHAPVALSSHASVHARSTAPPLRPPIV